MLGNNLLESLFARFDNYTFYQVDTSILSISSLLIAIITLAVIFVMAWKPRNPQPPQLPETNPVGVYQRDIEIPADWDGRDIFLRLEGAKSGVYVYVNGQEVGYSEDSKNPAEFLINNYLKPGKNSLVIKIFRWSTGSYLECQDFWRMSGIERDVFLFHLGSARKIYFLCSGERTEVTGHSRLITVASI